MTDKMPVLREPKNKKKSSRKLVGLLVFLFLVLLSVLFFRSPISKIAEINVLGQHALSAQAVQDAAGIMEGEPFFYPTASMLKRKVELLEPVESAVIHKQFPGRIDIEIREYPPVAYELTGSGEIKAILSNGTEVSANDNMVVDKPVLSGWSATDPLKKEITKLLSSVPPELLSDFSEIIPYPSNSYKDRIRIYTRSKFEIVTAVSLLLEKAETMMAVLETQQPGTVTLLLSDRYVPCEGPGEDEEEQE